MRAQALSEKDLAEPAKIDLAIHGLEGDLHDICGRALTPNRCHHDLDFSFEVPTSNVEIHHSNSGSSSSHSGGRAIRHARADTAAPYV